MSKKKKKVCLDPPYVKWLKKDSSTAHNTREPL